MVFLVNNKECQSARFGSPHFTTLFITVQAVLVPSNTRIWSQHDSVWFDLYTLIYTYIYIFIRNYNCHRKITWLPGGTELNIYMLDVLPWNVFFLSEHQKTLFPCEGDWTLAQIVRTSCGISILGDIHELSGHIPGQPVLSDPACTCIWTRWPSEVPFNLNHSGILWIIGN